MPRKNKEWIGKTDDTQPPPRVRLRVFDNYNGICQLSHRKIQAGEKWHLHHIKELIAGGENRESNLVPALVAPHKIETKKQMAVKKKVNGTRKKHLGITKNKPWPKPQKQSNRKAPRITKQPVPFRPIYRSE